MTTGVRGQEVGLSVKLIVEECCDCGVVFALSAELQRRRRDDHRTFYCPNGHGQSYTGKTDAEKLREQLRTSENRRQWAEDSERLARERAATAERCLSATRGVVTKMRKRAIAGACQFCHRHFANVERHVASKHAGASPETTS